MRKFVIASALVLATVASAHADGYRHYHGGNGGGGNGAAIIGGLLGGMIIGGAINQMYNPPGQYGVYNAQRYYAPQPQTYCQLEEVYDRYGRYMGRQQVCYQD